MAKTAESSPRTVGAIAALCGLFALSWALSTVSSWRISEDEQTVPATVVDLIRSGNSKRPVLEYVDPATGQVATIESNTSVAGIPNRIGEEAEVVIDANGDASMRGSLLTAYMLLMVASLFSGCGFYLMVHEPKRLAAEQQQHSTPDPQDRVTRIRRIA